jgi:hypothetical protein
VEGFYAIGAGLNPFTISKTSPLKIWGSDFCFGRIIMTPQKFSFAANLRSFSTNLTYSSHINF